MSFYQFFLNFEQKISLVTLLLFFRWYICIRNCWLECERLPLVGNFAPRSRTSSLGTCSTPSYTGDPPCTSIVLSLLTPMVVWSGSRWGSWERGSPRFRGSSPDFVRLSRLRYLHTITCTSTSTSRFVSGNCTQGFPTSQTSFTVYFPVYKLCASSLVLCFSSFSLSSSLSFFSSLFSFLYICCS